MRSFLSIGPRTTICIDSDQQRQAPIWLPKEGLRSAQMPLKTLTAKLEAHTKPQRRRRTRNIYR